MRVDVAAWRVIDRACAHLILARFGPYSERARASLYRTAALLLETAAELLREEAEGAEGAERMVRTAYERP